MTTDPGAAPVDYTVPDLEPAHRGRPQTRYGGASLYVEPDPVTVAKLWRSHGWQTVRDRYHWKGHTELQGIRTVGEERLAALSRRARK